MTKHEPNGVLVPEVNGASNAPKGPISTYPKSRISLEDRFIDEPRTLRVAVIGAGLAGVIAGILLPAKVPSIDLVIYEKNEDVGGTWLENVYPGVRCDIPAHVYQSTFSPNTQWSEKFAAGPEIRDYWQSVARKYDVYRHIKLGYKVEELEWDGQEGMWTVRVRDLKTGEVSTAEHDFVLTAIGRFNDWKLPEYPGTTDFKGLLRHSSHWDPAFNLTGTKVAVIGNGASGIQLVANIQKAVSRLDHYARNPTWIAASWAGDERTFEPQPYSADEKETFKDPHTYLKFRKGLEEKYWRRFASFLRGTEENIESRQRFTQIMKERLAKKPELIDRLIPEFSPNCRRLTPGPGYLEALSEDNVEYIQTPIKRLTETGIETVDGTHREVDAIFCSTGANVDMAPPFSIRANGLDLKTAWKHDGEFGFPYTYFGLASSQFPNLLFVHGPHGTGPSGTVPHSVEVQLTYFAKLLRKVASEGIKSIQPSRKAADEFVEYCDAFFLKTVLTDDCSSWYNGARPGARIHGIWPGSAGHVTIVRNNPRWEDWEYEYLSESGNRFEFYFGNGWTRREIDPDSDMTPYLKLPTEVDLRDLHESWWDLP